MGQRAKEDEAPPVCCSQDILIGAGKLVDTHTVKYSLPGGQPVYTGHVSMAGTSCQELSS